MLVEPRYLFRRAVALGVDLFLAGLVAFLLTVPFVAVQGTDTLRFGNAPVWRGKCVLGDTITPEMHAHLGRVPLQVTYCQQWVLGVYNGATAELILSQASEGRVTRTHSAHKAVTNDGVPIWPGEPDVPLGIALMTILSAAFLARSGRRTPGKALVGLRVAGLSGPADALRREGARGMPILVLTFINVAFGIFFPAFPTPGRFTPAQITWIGFGIGLPLLALLVWYYIVPFFRGDHRARWDRVVGSRVERS